MLAVAVNTVAVIIGSLIGLVLKRGIPKKIADTIMTGVGLCTVYIGITGSLKGENAVVTIISMVLGAAVGTAVDIDKRLRNLGDRIGSIKKNGGNISEGFVTASLFFCVGAMSVVGSLNAGLSKNYEMLFTKSLLDFISSIMLSVSLGIGVMIACVSVFVYQGLIVLLCSALSQVLTAGAIAEMTCAGSLLIVALGLNFIGATKIKIANFLPAIVFSPIVYYGYEFIKVLLS